MPSASAHLAVDAPRKLANAIASFLGKHPEALLDGSGDRRPEVLGIRPLPEYGSLQEAMKVGPLACCDWLCLHAAADCACRKALARSSRNSICSLTHTLSCASLWLAML